MARLVGGSPVLCYLQNSRHLALTPLEGLAMADCPDSLFK